MPKPPALLGRRWTSDTAVNAARSMRTSSEPNEYGATRCDTQFTHPDRETAKANNAAAIARQEAAALRGMSVQDAAARITAQRDAAKQARLDREARARKLHASHDPFERHSRHSSTSYRDGPSLGL